MATVAALFAAICMVIFALMAVASFFDEDGDE